MKKLPMFVTTTVGLSTLVAASLTFAPAAMAAEPEAPSISSGSAIPDSTWTALEAAISPESQTFDGALARRNGVSHTLVSDFATGWRAAGNPTSNVVVDTAMLTAIQADAPAPRACAGKNRADHTGLQYNYYLNSCNTSTLVHAIAVGAGAAAIAGIIMAATGVGGAVAGVIAGALTMAGGVIGICSSKGRGLVAHIIQFTNVVWCNNQ